MVVLCSGHAIAATYSVSGDFSPTSNPNGPWAYGTLTALGGTFAKYTTKASSTEGGTVNAWATSKGGAPADLNNASGTAWNNGSQVFLPGWAAFAPAVCGGPGCDLSDFRFTAPASGLYDLSLSFQSADLSGNLNTIVYVYIKGSTVFTANIKGAPSGSPHTFNGVYNLTAGETVDIAVASNNGTGFNDDTAVQGTISSTLPQIGTVQPNSLDAGAAAFTLTVNGSQFLSGDTVDWNGIPLTTTFVSASKLTAKVTAADVAAAGSAAVTVVDPTAGNAASTPVLFSIPLTSIAVSAQTIKSISSGYSVTLTLTNSGFDAATDIALTGAYLGTSASTSLPLNIASIAPKGTKTVTLNFPASAGIAGEAEYLSISGSYTGGGISLTSVETLP